MTTKKVSKTKKSQFKAAVTSKLNVNINRGRSHRPFFSPALPIIHKPSGWWVVLGVFIVVIALFIRVINLDLTPPSLYWEEVALGYDAYSIWQTGLDHHGHAWPIVAFESFGDWKPSWYFYATAPVVGWLGLNEWAVRLPSVMAGVLIVIGVGYLVKELLQNTPELTQRTGLSLSAWQIIAMALTAISPWAIQFSRAGFEANLATSKIVWGVVCFWWGIGIFSSLVWSQDRALVKNTWWASLCGLGWWLVAVVLLVSSMYTYHSARLVAPLLGIGLVWLAIVELYCAVQKQKMEQLGVEAKAIKSWVIGWGVVKKLWWPFLISGLVAIVLVAPLAQASFSTQTQQRLAETSIFTDLKIIEESNTLQALADNNFIARLIYHRYILFGRQVVSNWLSHFTVAFLVVTGDANLRHGTGFMGILYHIELLFLLVGLGTAFYYRRSHWVFLAWWLVVGVFPAAITKASPHALRILPTLPVFITLVSVGLVMCLSYFNELGQSLVRQFIPRAQKYVWPFLMLAVLAAYSVQVVMWWRYYSWVYPVVAASEWQYGYKDMVRQVQKLEASHKELPVFITREYGRPAMYYWFYTATDPRRVQLAEKVSKKDQGEFLEFENKYFVNSVNEINQAGIIAASPGQIKTLQQRLTIKDVVSIKDLQGKVVWQVGIANQHTQ